MVKRKSPKRLVFRGNCQKHREVKVAAVVVVVVVVDDVDVVAYSRGTEVVFDVVVVVDDGVVVVAVAVVVRRAEWRWERRLGLWRRIGRRMRRPKGR